MIKQTYTPTKPKVFYDLMKLFEKINTANKNIARYSRTTIIEPYILDNMALAMKKIIAKSMKTKQEQTLGEVIQEIEIAREFFMFYSVGKKLNYNQNFILEANMEFENILKQIYGWQKSTARSALAATTTTN